MKLRYYQKEAIDNTFEYIKSGGESAVIALPTGSGKSIVITELVRLFCELGKKVVILSHVKEILEQNYDEIFGIEGIDLGIYSSMIGKKEIRDVTVAGIQSAFRQAEKFKQFDIVLIDEAHRVSQEKDTMYAKFLKEIGTHKLIGLTATPYRLGTGYIYGTGKMFEKCTCDYTSSENFLRLVKDGFLCPLTVKRTKLEMDTSNISLKGGEFNERQLSDRFDRTPVTNQAIKEIIAAGRNRKHWLIFAIDINHAEHIAEVLLRNGINCLPVHSKMLEFGLKRDKVIKDYKNGKIRCIVNVGILTTGFNFPGIDLIAMLRPTNSPSLHVQTLGRGCRPDKKSNCLVLDFAGNTQRIGPVNSVIVRESSKGAEGGAPITKVCPECDTICHASARNCPDCGHKFQITHNLVPSAGDFEIIEDGGSKWIGVKDVKYSIHKGLSVKSVLVEYDCWHKKIREWICVEHKGYAKQKADHWVKYRGGFKCNTCDQLIAQSKQLRKPRRILVSKKNNYYVVSDAKF